MAEALAQAIVAYGANASTPGAPQMSSETDRGLPGTYVFDGVSSRLGYRMNKLFMTLRDAPAREEFLADEAAYCDRFGLSAEQKRAVLDRDWQAMLDLGGSIFYIYKLAMMDGRSMQYLGGVFTGMSEEEFVAAMVAGGRTDG
jgi:protocatechuate 4,5-dioxygenase alpha chain